MSVVGEAVAASYLCCRELSQLRRFTYRKLFGRTRIFGLRIRITASSLLGYFVLRSVVG